MQPVMKCRSSECGACCIAISISSPIPGMPTGKPAGIPCIHLTENNLCALFDSPLRPAICSSFQPDTTFCGNNREEAFSNILALETATTPTGKE